MQIIEVALFSTAFAILNRARGSKLFDFTDSTEIGRLVSTGVMSLMTALLFLPQNEIVITAQIITWACLMLWCSFGWDKYWSATIGHDPHHSRLWGLGMLTLRMSIGAPAIIYPAVLSFHPENYWYALGVLTLGLPYYLWGYIYPRAPIPAAEYTVGALLGLFIWLAHG